MCRISSVYVDWDKENDNKNPRYLKCRMKLARQEPYIVSSRHCENQ